jgi:hemolysin D
MKRSCTGRGEADAVALAREFSPAILRLTETPPHPLGRQLLWTVCALLALLAVWAVVGRLDVVAVAGGKLIPRSYVKIVQPSEGGIVREILVSEGEKVRAGQVLMRMDALITDADARALEADLQRKRATLERIDAELADRPYVALPGDPPELARETAARYRANREALAAALAEEESRLAKARDEVALAEQVHARLGLVLPHYVRQDQAFERLARDGFVGTLMASDKKRERIEKEQELVTQAHLVDSARDGVRLSQRRLVQIDRDYRRQLHAERSELRGQAERLAQEVAKQAHRQALLELRAGQDSVVKDLTTHSIGAVVQPGTVLLTLVPNDDALRAEVWVSNDDIGFVRKGQLARVKLAAFPFQKYGMVEGEVEHVSADAAEESFREGAGPGNGDGRNQALAYKALIALKSSDLVQDGLRFPLSAGMQASVEILLGERSVAEYLLSPLQKAWHETGTER